MFIIETFTQATINSVTPRVEKHGDEDKPAVSIKLSIEGPNTLLDAIDPQIRLALYKPKDDEPTLPGVEVATPVLRCNAFEKHTLTASHEGWTLAIDNELDDTSPMLFGGCKCDKFSVDAKQGGSIVLTIRVGTSDIDADRLGWLGMHNGEDIWITLTPPTPKAEAIDGTVGHPGAQPGGSAEDLFTAGAGPEDEGSEGGDPDIEDDEDAGPELEDRLDNALAAADAEQRGEASKAALDAVGNPFGSREAELQAEAAAGASKRTARGREATKRALAEGLAAAQAAGVE